MDSEQSALYQFGARTPARVKRLLLTASRAPSPTPERSWPGSPWRTPSGTPPGAWAERSLPTAPACSTRAGDPEAAYLFHMPGSKIQVLIHLNPSSTLVEFVDGASGSAERPGSVCGCPSSTPLRRRSKQGPWSVDLLRAGIAFERRPERFVALPFQSPTRPRRREALCPSPKQQATSVAAALFLQGSSLEIVTLVAYAMERIGGGANPGTYRTFAGWTPRPGTWPGCGWCS